MKQKKKKQMGKNQQSISDQWNNFKQCNMHVIEVSEGGWEEWKEIFEEMMTKIFPNLKKSINSCIQEAQ